MIMLKDLEVVLFELPILLRINNCDKTLKSFLGKLLFSFAVFIFCVAENKMQTQTKQTVFFSILLFPLKIIN